MVYLKPWLKARERLGHQPPVTVFRRRLGAEQTRSLETLLNSTQDLA
jgi:hypothetical protein